MMGYLQAFSEQRMQASKPSEQYIHMHACMHRVQEDNIDTLLLRWEDDIDTLLDLTYVFYLPFPRKPFDTLSRCLGGAQKV